MDWGSVKQRLEQARAAVEKVHRADGQEAGRILAERARALATPLRTEESTEGTIGIVEFQLRAERYAVETRWVREVLYLRDLTPLPGVPRHVLGIVNVRGRLISVMDLGRLFELPDIGLTDLNRVLIFQSPQMELGILADRIIGVHAISQPPVPGSLRTLKGIRERYVRFVTADRLIVLDAEAMLADPTTIVNMPVSGQR